MANENILVFEAPWSSRIDRTQATRDIHTPAETLLLAGPEPVRVTHRSLVSSRHVQDIGSLASLECNQCGPNFILFSAYGSFATLRHRQGRVRRAPGAFEGIKETLAGKEE